MKDLQGGLEDVDESDRREAEAVRAGAACRELGRRRHRERAGPGIAVAGGRPPARPGARAAWRRRAHRPRVPQPLARRLLDLLRLPARDERVPVVHALRPAQPAALGRACELPLPARGRPPDLAGGEEHALVHRGRRPAAGRCSRSGSRCMLTRARRGVGVFRTVFYLPALVPPVAATLGFVYLLNPSTGPVNTILGKVGIDGPLWFNDPGWSKPSLVMLGLWGVGNTMIIFLAAVLDVPRHLYESAELDGAGAFQRLRWVTLPHDQPRDPLRGRARGDPGRCSTSPRPTSRRASPPGQAIAGGLDEQRSSSGTPRARRSSTRSCSTTTGSGTSTWATRRRWRCCSCVVAFAVTAIIIRELAALRALPGSGAMSAASLHRGAQPVAATSAFRARSGGGGCSS